MLLDGLLGEWVSDQGDVASWPLQMLFYRPGQLAATLVAASWAFAVRSPAARRDLVRSVPASLPSWAVLVAAGAVVPGAKVVGILVGAMQGVWLLPVRALFFTTLVASGWLLGGLVAPRCRCRSTLVAHLGTWLYLAIGVNHGASELLDRWGSEVEPFVLNPHLWEK